MDAPLRLSARAALLQPSPTLGITAKAAALRAEGRDVLSFAAGEPDFDTPEPIRDAAINALNHGFTRYTPSAGAKDLREAIVAKLARENGLAVAPEQVVVSCGAKHALYESMQVLLDPGDEVILIAPYWMTYADQVRLAGGVPVVVHAASEANFIPTHDQLRAAITARTRAIVVNTPSNPTGAVLPRQTLKEIAALALRHDLWILSDEIYERLQYTDEPHVSIATLGREVAARTITINGCSKTFAMTGWRIGYAAAPLPVAKALSNLQDQITSGPTTFAQKGAVAALNLPAEAVSAMRDEFAIRRDLIVGLLREIPDVSVPEPGGAFYAFPNVSAYLSQDLASDTDLASYLLDKAEVATVPGGVFEGAGHLRLSYAASRDHIRAGVARIAGALAALRA